MMGQVGIRMHSKGIIGRCIEWATDSQTHHVVVHVGDARCVSAEFPVARVRKTSDYPAMVWSQFDLTDEQAQRIALAALTLVNRPYNVPVLFVHLATKLGIRTPRFVVDWLKRRPAVDCSDLADRALTAGGIDLFSQEPTLVTPADFQREFEARGWLDKQAVSTPQ